jgi:hypothetical protein
MSWGHLSSRTRGLRLFQALALLDQCSERDAAHETLGEWAGISDDALEAYADGVLGIYKGTVVTAYDVTGWSRGADDRITFEGTPSTRWSSLIGGLAGVPGGARRRARQRTGVEVSDLVDALGELPAVRGALVAVVVHGVVQVRVAVAPVNEL